MNVRQHNKNLIEKEKELILDFIRLKKDKVKAKIFLDKLTTSIYKAKAEANHNLEKAKTYEKMYRREIQREIDSTNRLHGDGED